MAAKKKGQSMKKAADKGWEAGVDQDLMKALGHPLRIGILTILNERMASPNELSKELEEGLSQVSYHVKVLKDYSMIRMVKTEPRRGAVEHYYLAVEEVFLPSGQMKLMPKSAQRKSYNKVLAELDDDLGAALGGGTFDKRGDWVAARDPGVIDGQGREETEQIVADFLKQYREVKVEARKRIAAKESEPVPTTLAVLVFGTTEQKKAKVGKKAKKG